jgi:23S rRNA pseudouridine955/2504/2580 synthase
LILSAAFVRPVSHSPVAKIVVDSEMAGQRLDNFLLGNLKGVPRSHVYRLIRSGQVRVNSGRTAARYRIKQGDTIRIPPIRQRDDSAPPLEPSGLQWLEERIIYEDARLIVLDKPMGLAVHGGSGVALGCIEAMRSLRPEPAELELAHRLDRETSGCLLIAKRRSALRSLHALLREGRVDKRYLALLKGAWPEGTTRVEVPLVKAHRQRKARVTVGRGGKLATSEFRLLERVGSEASFVEVSIGTGRTHQIRVQAAHAGHPVAGDDRYGDREFNSWLERVGLKRMFLHAHSVAFVWPDTGAPLAVSAPLPEDLKRALDAVSEARSRERAGRAPPPATLRRPKSRASRSAP